jgi:hypothetical protein
MRLVAAVLATSLVSGGCVSNSYRIESAELQRLVAVPPAARGQSVRVDQQLTDADVAPAERVDGNTVIIGPNINVDTGMRHDNWHVHGGGGGGGGGHLGGGGGDGKGMAIAIIVIAAIGLFIVAGIEGSKFDGNVQLHPMHPVHLFGRDGGYTVVPLAWLDPNLVAWADHAVVRSTEGPWHELDSAPLWRNGWTYGLYGGTGSLRSVNGDVELGPAFTIQLGYFPTQELGILGSVFFGWRDNSVQQTLFESRYTAEVQYLPLSLADTAHAGLYGGFGAAYRLEDGLPGGNNGSMAFDGGAMFQLKLHTRIALTARLGIAEAHGEQMRDAMFGLSVY